MLSERKGEGDGVAVGVVRYIDGFTLVTWGEAFINLKIKIIRLILPVDIDYLHAPSGTLDRRSGDSLVLFEGEPTDTGG